MAHPKPSRHRGTADIYTLTDPRTGEPFYVGYTQQPLAARLYQHMHGNKGVAPQKQQRIAAIVDAGLIPRIERVARVHVTIAPRYERFWWQRLTAKGHQLLQKGWLS